jgi:geranylgeranyl reductase family protein
MLHALIAGAGPAGSTVALLLARAGRAVCIYERSAFPRTKACGEYLSPASVRVLHELDVAAQLAPHARRVRGVRLHGHGVHARIDFPQPGWSLPRCVLDDALLQAALHAGAYVVQARAEDCGDGDDRAHMTIRFPDGTLGNAHAHAIVGADGMHSLVARKCGLAVLARRPARFALGGHYAGFTQLDEYIDMFVDGRTYAAINPLTDTTANVMLIVDQAELESHRDGVEAFAQERAQQLAGDIIAGAYPEHKRIAIGPLAYRAERLAGKRALLVGDAACFVDPFTGQGVYLALRCAQIAAESIILGDLRRYAAVARREIAARERAARRVSALVASPLAAKTAASLLQRRPSMLRSFVRQVTGAA